MPEQNALKTLNKTDDELRVANYIAMFGGRDLTEEYFTADTKFESDYTKTGVLYVDWEHGLGKLLDGDESPGPDDILGTVDWKTAKIDDKGLWVERVLNRRNEYMQWLETLIDAGLVGNSTEAVASGVEKTKDGEITRWPLKRDTLTVNPAEPRMMNENIVTAFKSLDLDDLLPPFPEQETEPEADSDGGEAKAAVDDGEPTTEEEPLQEDLNMDEEIKTITMTEEELSAAIESAVTKAVKSLPANDPPKAKSKVEVTIDEADRPFKSAGEFYLAVADASRGRSADVRLRSLKVQDDDGYYVRQYKAEPTGMGEEQPVYGGYLVGTDQPAGLVERMYQDGEVLNRVSWINISPNANGIVLNGLDETDRDDSSRWGGVLGYWVAEAGALTATKPLFRQMQLRLNKVAAAVYMTDELLADASAAESWINRVAPAELRFKVEDAIINGSGAGKPKGIITDSAIYASISAETGQAATTFIYENAVKMWAQMWAPSRRNAVWFINQDVEPQLHTMSLAVGTGGIPVYLPAGGASGQPYSTLFGRPVIPIEYAQTLGTLGDVILADMSQYVAIRKGGIQAASSMHVQFLYDEMVYRFIYRVDGQSLWHSSLTPKNSSNVQSPFCVVATRS